MLITVTIHQSKPQILVRKMNTYSRGIVSQPSNGMIHVARRLRITNIRGNMAGNQLEPSKEGFFITWCGPRLP